MPPRRPEEKTPSGTDRPRKPAEPGATEESIQGARQALERLRRYLRATQPDDRDGEDRRSA